MPKDRACANTPALPRRSFLAGAAASISLTPDAAEATPADMEFQAYLKGLKTGRDNAWKDLAHRLEEFRETDQRTPIRKVFESWQTLYHELDFDSGTLLSDDEHEACCDALCQLEIQIGEMPAQTPEDVICKIAAQSEFGEYGLEARPKSKDWWPEAEKFLA